MPWTLTADVAEFRLRAEDLLAEDPVQNAPLLTETAYLTAVPSSSEDLLFGSWTDGEGKVSGAFVRAPRHPPLLTHMPGEALSDLVTVLPAPTGLGVPEPMASETIAQWRQAGTTLSPRQSFTVHRLDELTASIPPVGRARVAGPADRALLHRWFDDLMAALPDDSSDRAYVIDDPLEFGGLMLWEVDSVPVAMCGRSRTIASTVRLGPWYAPGANAVNAEAALAAASAAASREARHVVVVAPASAEQEARRLASVGFTPVASRVLLAPDA